MASIILHTVIAAGLAFWSLQGRAESVQIVGDAIEVEDGDTIRVAFDDGVRRIQLTGIDAPEDTENPKFAVDLKRTGLSHETLMSLGVIATGHLNRLVVADHGYRLQYDAASPDKYGRLPGELFTLDGLSINLLMVEEGYAIALPGAPSTFLPLQRQAESERKGLWGLLAAPTRLWAGVDASR